MQSQSERSGSHLEELANTPRALAAKLSWLLPLIVVVREEDRLATEGGADTSHGDSLLLWTRASSSVAATGGWPSDLQVDTLLAWAKGVDNVELVLGKLTAGLGSDIAVEEWVDVGSHNVDDVAEDTGVLLKDVQWLSGGDWAVVTGRLEDLLGVGDETSELTWGAEAGEESLVTDDNKGDDIPVWEVGKVVNLWLGSWDTIGLDEDTDDQVESVLLAAVGNVLEAVAVSLVSRVEADSGESLGLDISEITGDLISALALAINGVWGVGKSPVVSVVTEGWTSGWWRDNLGLWLWCWWWSLLDNWGLNNWSWRWLLDNWSWWWWSWSGGWLSWDRDTLAGEWADVDKVGLGNGDNLLWVGVGTWSVGSWSWVDEDGGLLNDGGRWGDSVSTGLWADKGSLLDDRGDDTIGGLNSCDWANNGSSSLDNGGDTAVGVGSGWNAGGGSLADGGLLGHGDGGLWNSVGSWLWEDGDLSGWDWDNWDRDDLNWSLRWLWWSDDDSWLAVAGNPDGVATALLRAVDSWNIVLVLLEEGLVDSASECASLVERLMLVVSSGGCTDCKSSGGGKNSCLHDVVIWIVVFL